MKVALALRLVGFADRGDHQVTKGVALEELAQASESEDEPNPLGQTRELLVRLLRNVELDAQTRRIQEMFNYAG